MSYFRNTTFVKPEIPYSTLRNVDIFKHQLEEYNISEVGDYFNLLKGERIHFAEHPLFKVVDFIHGSSIVRCNLISCYREKNGAEYSSWFNLNYLLAKDEDDIPLFPHLYVKNNIQERVDLLLDMYNRCGSFSKLGESLTFQAYEMEILGGFNGYAYRDIKGYRYNTDIPDIKKFTLSTQNNVAEMIRCLHQGFKLYKIALMIAENLSNFNARYKIKFKSGFFDSKTTYGLEYDEDSWTYTFVTSYTSLSSLKEGINKDLLSHVKNIRSLIPSNRWQSLVYDLIKSYFR